ncbi:hypothetical protein [Novosphingobium sp.]|uniref:hypothetical protein n=1 Tax=Novosphingobium sp. TaxID=1874826 RepID=UPI00286AF5C2|nr:hypothetical protein [Novosphingobium sp.]
MKHFRTLALPAALAASAIIAAPALAGSAISVSQADSILNNRCAGPRERAEKVALQNGDPRDYYTAMARGYLTTEMPIDQIQRLISTTDKHLAGGNVAQQTVAELMYCVLEVKLTYAR